MFGNLLSKFDKLSKGEVDLTNAELAMIESRGSITKFLSTFIIEPTLIVSKDLRDTEVIERMLEVQIDVFTSYYAQAFSIMTSVYGLDSKTAFDMLSSNGLVMDRTMARSNVMSDVSFEEMDQLPFNDLGLEDTHRERSSSHTSRVENSVNISEQKGVDIPATIQKTINICMSISSSSSTVDNNTTTTTVNLTNGQNRTTVDRDNNSTSDSTTTNVTIPVLIKAHVVFTDNKNIVNMLEVRSDDKRFGARLDEYRSTGISLKDFLFAKDLVAEYKEHKIRDKDDLIGFTDRRSTNANVKNLSAGATGFNKYYSLITVSKENLASIERVLRGKVSKPKYNNKFMENSKAMMLTVMDNDWERATMYTKDLTGHSDISYKALNRRKNRSDMADLAEIFKAISANKPPVF